MKNISFYKIAFIIAPLFIIFSCVKEQDVTTTTTDNPGPIENTDIYLVQGIVKDTLGQAIGGVSLKAYFDDLEIETTSDMDGNYEFKIPKSKTEGYVVVGSKVNFSKAITPVKQVNQRIEKDIFLVRNFFSGPLDISLARDSLITILGRVVDENGTPVPDARYYASQLGVVDGNLKLFILGYGETEEDGTFEIVSEKEPITGTSFRTSHPTVCGSQNGKFWTDDVEIKDLGDIVVMERNQASLSTNLSVSNCNSTDASGIVYFVEDPITSLFDIPLGTLNMDYCEDPSISNLLYFGMQNEDKTEFDGIFQPLDQIQTNTSFDLCTPNDNFLEIIMDGDTTVVTDLVYEASADLIQSPSLSEKNYFFSFRRTGNLQTGGGQSILMGDVSFFSCLNMNTEPIFNLDESSPSFINFIENNDDLVSGVVFCKLKNEANGSINDAKIRFRIIK